MKLSKFRYKLPPELIAQYPAANRDECRLMVLDRKTGNIEHKVFKDVIEYFDEAGMDVDGAVDDEILEADEVFDIGDGRYLIVEA